jgi:predicted MFS family arabinose efflux permease
MSALPISERKLVFLLASVQFVNILDFMMVMPLGPAFATALGIPTSRLGLVGGSYTMAAFVAGVVGALFLDKFDRRRALAVAMLGLVLGTVSGAFAHDFASLIAARVVAGAFGGPASAIALAILMDAVPPERRGKAIGAVYGAFAAASVLGVPAGLRLSILGGWRAPFFAVAALGVVVVGAALAMMPPFRMHLERGSARIAARPLRQFLADRRVLLCLSGTTVMFMGIFAMVPNLATYFVLNLGYPQTRLDLLYFVGGAISFVAMRMGGGLVDRRGPMPLTIAGTLLMLSVFAAGFVPARPVIPVMATFVGFMLANAIRSVALNTLASKVPQPTERARFMSAQNAAQHLSASLGAMVSSVLLLERPDRSLGGMPSVALLAMALAATLPFIVAAIGRRLTRPA